MSVDGTTEFEYHLPAQLKLPPLGIVAVSTLYYAPRSIENVPPNFCPYPPNIDRF